ncbi:hypothetical protein BD779DRAFT_1502678 [Infundibulicybe gibba]|nr:hypothetical protein BD779DRAFT_1502678 [Infundibulicybe gibba]
MVHNHTQNDGKLFSTMPSSSSSSSSSTAVDSDSSVVKHRMPTRIRFAPLPDPRRAVLIADDGDETPLDMDNDSASLASSSGSFPPDLSPSCSSSAVTTPTQSEDHSTPPSIIPAVLQKPRHSWLRPFKKLSSSSSSLSSTNTLTQEHLYRAPSNATLEQQDAASSSSPWAPLTRWASATAGKARQPTTTMGSPLARTQSTQSFKNAAKLPPPPVRPATAPSRKGTLMLNGRVYGARRPNTAGANPFANARDEADPEFVEWGYGGMGSVRSGGAVWGRLQSSGVAVGSVESGSATRASSADTEDDDGSGMGWVRRRREMREKERKEKLEHEKRAAEAVTPPATEEKPVSPPLTHNPSTTSAATITSTSHAEDQEHILSAVTVPVHHHRHHHHHRPSSSGGASAHAPAPLSPIPVSPISPKSSSESSSGTESEDSNAEESDSDGDVEEQEQAREEQRRRTARGAGVEKISRHK